MMATVKENYSDPQNSYDITLHIPKLTNRRRYFLKQKTLGLLAVIGGIASPILFQDATVSIILLPLGLYVLFTKQEVIYR